MEYDFEELKSWKRAYKRIIKSEKHVKYEESLWFKSIQTIWYSICKLKSLHGLMISFEPVWLSDTSSYRYS